MVWYVVLFVVAVLRHRRTGQEDEGEGLCSTVGQPPTVFAEGPRKDQGVFFFTRMTRGAEAVEAVETG